MLSLFLVELAECYYYLYRLLARAVSLFKYFQRKEGFLPTPEQAGLSENATKAANTAVMEVKSMKRKHYINFIDEERAKVGQFAAENGNNVPLRSLELSFQTLEKVQ